MILLAGAGAVSLMLLYVFMRWERSAREHWVVFLLLGLLVVDSSLWDNETTEPQGLFHPGTGTLNFRLPEVIITVALVARLLIRGKPERVGLPALLWLAVAAWWTLEAMEGVLRHNSMVKLPYEAKAIIYVMGAYALASGVPIRRFLEGRGFERLVRWSALTAALLLVLRFGHKKFALNIPGLRLLDFGSVGTDAATIFVSIGVIGFLLELGKEQRSRLNILCTVPLALSAFFAYQRAVLLTLGAVVAVVVIVASGSTARRRLRIRSGEVAVAALAVVGVVLGVAVIPAITSQKSVTGPLAATISRTVGATLNSQAKQQSAQDRINKWTVSFADAKQHPILGQGLGFEYSYFQAGAESIHHDRPDREHRPRPVAADRTHRTGDLPAGAGDLARERVRHLAVASRPDGGGPRPRPLRRGRRARDQRPGRVDLRELSAGHGARALARHAPQRGDLRRGRPGRHA